MKFLPTKLPEVMLVTSDVYRDARGVFLETYHAQKYTEGGISAKFVQDNFSRSLSGTLRGLHAQLVRPQGKLIRAVRGEIFDVAVDIRRNSPTFAAWVGVRLNSDEFQQIYIPPGFAHGFCVLSEIAEIEYKCTDFYEPTGEMTVRWNDPMINIDWPIDSPVLSEKDGTAQGLEDQMERLPLREDSDL